MYLLLISLLQHGPLECLQVYQPLVNLRALERPGRSRVVVPLGLFFKFLHHHHHKCKCRRKHIRRHYQLPPLKADDNQQHTKTYGDSRGTRSLWIFSFFSFFSYFFYSPLQKGWRSPIWATLKTNTTK